MDIGSLDVGVNYKYEHLFEEKEDEPLFTLIEQGLPKSCLDSVFNESLEDDIAFLMTMQMTSGSSSIGSSQAVRPGIFPAVESYTTDKECQRMYAEFSSNIGSNNILYEDYTQSSRERKFSTSSFTGQCIPPDLMMSSQLTSSPSDDFFVDNLPDIEEVQEQIFLEDGHRTLQPDDLLIPLDEPMDSKVLQEQLMNKITGSTQPLLPNDTCDMSPTASETESLPDKREVSLISHKSLVICTQNVKGKGRCTCCKHFNKRCKKKVRFDLDQLDHEMMIGEDVLETSNAMKNVIKEIGTKECCCLPLAGVRACTGEKGTPCQLTRFLQTLANFGIGKKAIIRNCRKVSTKTPKKGSYTLTRLHLPSKVKRVETTPGSQNVCIDGMDVQLPAGSIILAVVDESGSLVPIPATDLQSFDTGVEAVVSTPTPTPESVVSTDSSGLIPSTSPVEDSTSILTSTSLLDTLMSPKETPEPLSGGGTSRLQGVLPLEATMKLIASEMEKKLSDDYFEDGAIGEEYVDIETVSERTPVIEAVDLDSLLAEFEATESVNKSLAKGAGLHSWHIPCIVPKNSPARSPTPTSSIPTTLPTTPPFPKSSLIKVEKQLPQEEILRQTLSVGHPKLLNNISIKVKKVEKGKPTKSLIERKNQMMMKKMTVHQRIMDSLPIEIIEKIRASGKRSSTKILSESLIPKLKRGKRSSTKATNLAKKNATNAVKKKKGTDKKKFQMDEGSEDICATPFPTKDHDYCISPQKQMLRERGKEEEEEEETEETQGRKEAKKKKSDEGEDACKKDSGVESGDASDCSTEAEESKRREREVKESQSERREREVKESQSERRDAFVTASSPEVEVKKGEANMYCRLPDYVMDVGNVGASKEVSAEEEKGKACGQECPPVDVVKIEIKQEVKDEEEEEPKKKRKLKLSEYRMRIRSSADNSRSCSPLVGEDVLDKKRGYRVLPGVVVEVSGARVVVPVTINSVPKTVTEDREEGEIKEEVEDVPEDGDTQNIPETAKVPTKVKAPLAALLPLPKRVTNGEIKEIAPRVSSASSTSSSSSTSKASRNVVKKKPTVIEIDLEEEEAEKEKYAKAQSKLGLIDSLPLSKMPTTSLGHSLLYSRKNGDTPEKRPSKYDYGKASGRHNSSSRSRSRSRSRSSKKSSRRQARHKSKGGSSYTSGHRKSRRRWSRSRSRGRSRSRSLSICSSSSSVSVSSSRSRSTSRSYSKSYNSRSRSRSRSRRRKNSWSSRSRKYSRGQEKSRRRSGSRTPCDWSSSSNRRRTRTRSPNWGYRQSRSPYGKVSSSASSTCSTGYNQPHMSTRYMSRHRSIEEIEKDVQERRVIYVGAVEEGTTRTGLRRRFEKFGQIVDINIHFRERGDNYGFVTFKYRENAYQALEHGNDDPTQARYNLCFGGRRSFCKVQYSDLDAQNDEYGYHNAASNMDYDSLLQAALQMRR